MREESSRRCPGWGFPSVIKMDESTSTCMQGEGPRSHSYNSQFLLVLQDKEDGRTTGKGLNRQMVGHRPGHSILKAPSRPIVPGITSSAGCIHEGYKSSSHKPQAPHSYPLLLTYLSTGHTSFDFYSPLREWYSSTGKHLDGLSW